MTAGTWPVLANRRVRTVPILLQKSVAANREA
jgi:hypothetical protein